MNKSAHTESFAVQREGSIKASKEPPLCNPGVNEVVLFGQALSIWLLPLKSASANICRSHTGWCLILGTYIRALSFIVFK